MTLRQARELATKYNMKFTDDGEIITRPTTIQARRELDNRNSLNFDITDLHATDTVRTDECVPQLVTLKSDSGRRKTIRTADHITYRPEK